MYTDKEHVPGKSKQDRQDYCSKNLQSWVYTKKRQLQEKKTEESSMTESDRQEERQCHSKLADREQKRV